MRLRMECKRFLCARAFDTSEGGSKRARMVDLSKKIRAVRDKAGMNQTRFAEALGVTQSTVSRWEKSTDSQIPEADVLAKFKAVFGYDLLADVTVPTSTINHKQKLKVMVEPPAPLPTPSFFDSRDKIPVYASVEGGPGEMVVSTEPIDWAVRPWYLREVKDGYAVVVVGESMAPAFEPGDLAIVNPKAPLVRNKIAIFVREEYEGDFTATIKRLVRQTPTCWVVEQFNPPDGMPSQYELARSLYPKAYRVVGKYDGG